MGALLLVPARAQAQGWDYGRNMFGFAQYYPGSGWSSYYHPQFDRQAWYPTALAGLHVPLNGAGVAPPGGWVWCPRCRQWHAQGGLPRRRAWLGP